MFYGRYELMITSIDETSEPSIELIDHANQQTFVFKHDAINMNIITDNLEELKYIRSYCGFKLKFACYCISKDYFFDLMSTLNCDPIHCEDVYEYFESEMNDTPEFKLRDLHRIEGIMLPKKQLSNSWITFRTIEKILEVNHSSLRPIINRAYEKLDKYDYGIIHNPITGRPYAQITL